MKLSHISFCAFRKCGKVVPNVVVMIDCAETVGDFMLQRFRYLGIALYVSTNFNDSVVPLLA